MEYKAVAKNIRMSPRKVRLVTDAIRSLSVDKAVKQLGVIEKRASTPLKKTIESAIANAVNNESAKKESLSIKEILIDEGITYKRYRFASRGRVAPYKRRSSHITVVLHDNKTADKQVQESQEVSKKEAETEKKPEIENKTKEAKVTKKEDKK